MPAEDGSDAPYFAERLAVPWHWWPIGVIGVALGGAEVFAGFDWRIAVGVYLVLGLPVLAILIGLGRSRVTVDARGVHAGGRTLAAADIASVTVLDERATRARLGPAADPHAYAVTRGFVKTSVELTPVHPDAAPYWLLSSRRPTELADAVRTAVLPARD